VRPFIIFTEPRTKRAASARGAILVQVGLAIFVLMGLTAFVLDYGVFWLSRRQAQNAADAGALAGAVAMGFDETAYPPSAGGLAYQSAYTAARRNAVWYLASPPGVVVTWICPPFVAAGARCVQVDVYQDGTNGSLTLPTFFGKALGLLSQGVKATASAEVLVANGTNCLRPWLIPDRFTGPDWPCCMFQTGVDVYTAPSAGNPGTGYTIADINTEVTLVVTNPSGALNPSFFYRADLTGGGSAAYANNIANCANVTDIIGQQITTLPGNGVGPTNFGTNNLIAKDPNATWDFTNKRVINSCAPGVCPDGNYYTVSPRIVPVALFSPAEFVSLVRTTGRFNLTITNIMGFFVEGFQGQSLKGVIASTEGLLSTAGSPVGTQSGFNLLFSLIR
jgi:hypothetical protein